MARAHKQRILIAVIALCLAAVVIYAIFSGSNQFSLTVGGRKITKDELSFFFDQEKTQHIHIIHQHTASQTLMVHSGKQNLMEKHRLNMRRSGHSQNAMNRIYRCCLPKRCFPKRVHSKQFRMRIQNIFPAEIPQKIRLQFTMVPQNWSSVIFTTIFSAIKKMRFWLPCEQMERLRKTKSLCITQK